MNQQLMTLLPLVLLIAIMYFLLIRPQKKKEKAVNAMRGAVRVGDDIVTIGGICGKIVKTKDETLIIQVGADKTKMEVMRWSISKVENQATLSKKPVQDEEEEVEEAPKKVVPKKLTKTPAPEKVEAQVVKEADAEVTSEVEVEVELDQNATAEQK